MGPPLFPLGLRLSATWCMRHNYQDLQRRGVEPANQNARFSTNDMDLSAGNGEGMVPMPGISMGKIDEESAAKAAG